MRRPPLRALLGIAALLAMLLIGVVAAVRALPAEPAADAVTAPEPVSGAWACPVGDGRPGRDLEVISARPGDVGDDPGTIDLTVIDAGGVSTAEVTELLPTRTARFASDAGEGSAVAALWSDAPVALTREWRLDGAGDDPPGTIAGPCIQPFGDRWIVPGLSTVGSERAYLRFANPFAADATVAMTFLTPEGEEAPLALQNLTVPARATLEVAVNDHLPEREDLAAIAEVLSGRVAAEGYQLVGADIGGVDGATLLAASPAAEESWTVPWVVDSAAQTSWLWVTNPGDRTAAVEFKLHTGDGGDVPEGLMGIDVPPGTIRRIDLRNTLPEGTDTAAITARSEGVPIVVSGAVLTSDEQPEDDEQPEGDEQPEDDEPENDQEPGNTGYAIQLGASVPDRSWVVSAGDPTGRSEWLRLVNPGGDAASVDVVVVDGTSASPAAELRDLEVVAGGAIQVELTDELAGLEAWTAFVTADTDIVVGRLGASDGDGGLHLVAVLGQSAAAWNPSVRALGGAPEPGLLTRLHTALGIPRPDPVSEDTEDDPFLDDDDPLRDGPDDEPLDEDPLDAPDGTEEVPAGEDTEPDGETEPAVEAEPSGDTEPGEDTEPDDGTEPAADVVGDTTEEAPADG
jgi:hypothetical protein